MKSREHDAYLQGGLQQDFLGWKGSSLETFSFIQKVDTNMAVKGLFSQLRKLI